MRRLSPLHLVPFALATGCTGGPYSLLLSVDRVISGSSITTAYQIDDGGKPEERTGTIGVGENCVTARQTTGNRVSTRVFEVQEHFNVVGESEAELPLVPGEDEVSKVWASILRERRSIAASSETVEVSFDPSADPNQWTTSTYADDAITTTAGFYAVAADEFVVRMDLADLWEDLEEDLEPGDVDLMTLNDPQDGDIWPSQNGNSLYVYEGSQKTDIAGTSMKLDLVGVYGTGTVAPEGNDTSVYDQCFNFGLNQTQDNRADVETLNWDAMLLDPGCTGPFVHIKEGSQQWYNNVMVAETASVTFVTINDYGYAWVEEDEDAGTCTRVTSPYKEDLSALPFVQYDVTVTNMTTSTKTWVD
jgi:hypothetical protein